MKIKNFKEYISECSTFFDINRINIMMDKMYPNLKLKIFDYTKEKSDIHLALYELSKKNPKKFNEIWEEFFGDLYFYHQNESLLLEKFSNSILKDFYFDLIKFQKNFKRILPLKEELETAITNVKNLLIRIEQYHNKSKLIQKEKELNNEIDEIENKLSDISDKYLKVSYENKYDEDEFVSLFVDDENIYIGAPVKEIKYENNEILKYRARRIVPHNFGDIDFGTILLPKIRIPKGISDADLLKFINVRFEISTTNDEKLRMKMDLKDQLDNLYKKLEDVDDELDAIDNFSMNMEIQETIDDELGNIEYTIKHIDLDYYNGESIQSALQYFKKLSEKYQ